ncbi:hypothetical protein GCM10010402_56090 [Actinomadura luteofluorescens]
MSEPSAATVADVTRARRGRGLGGRTRRSSTFLADMLPLYVRTAQKRAKRLAGDRITCRKAVMDRCPRSTGAAHTPRVRDPPGDT